MRKVAIITSRQQSVRLPEKALKLIGRKPLIHHVVDRARQSNVDEVVVATTENSPGIRGYLTRNLIPFWVGDEEDQLSRIYDTAVKFEAELIIRLWGDSPLISPSIINKVIDLAVANDFDYTQTIQYPDGQRVTCLSFSSLEYAQKNMSAKRRTIFNEVDEPVYWMNNSRFKTGALVSPVNLSKLKLDVGTQEDLNNIRFIYENLMNENSLFRRDMDELKLEEKKNGE